MWLLDNDQFIGEVESYSRAAQFGDGLFETLSVQNNEVVKLDLHAKRLEYGMTVLGMSPLPVPTHEWLKQNVAKILKHANQYSGIVKVMVARAPSARGYGYDAQQSSHSVLTLSNAPVLDPHIYDLGVDVMSCQTLCSIQPSLAGIKHLNRLENVLARQEVINHEVFEGLMYDADGYLVEGTMTNVFLYKDDAWYTPKLDRSGVAGVMRAFVLEQGTILCRNIDAVKIHRGDLPSFESGFICNSILGMVPIRVIDGHNMRVTESMIQLAKDFRVWGGNE